MASLILMGLAAAASCERAPESPASEPRVAETSLVERAPTASARESARPRIVFLGDSLTAGLGLAPDEAYPSLLQERLDRLGYDYEVDNHGVSGDTSAGGLSRLDWALEGRPDGGEVRVLVVALGGNDGLRGVPPTEMQANLTEIVQSARAKGIAVLLVGIEAPPNMGRRYRDEFRQVFPDVASALDVPLVPFLLEGVGGVPELNQADGIHPTAQGARILADTVWDGLEPILATVAPS